MPSVLVELGYISNKQEESYLKSNSGQTSLARSIYNGFKEYKREYDKKSHVFSKDDNSGIRTTVPSSSTTVTEGREYKIQIFASDKKLESGSSSFKGLSPVDFYFNGGLYKYTYGSSNNLDKVKNELYHFLISYA